MVSNIWFADKNWIWFQFEFDCAVFTSPRLFWFHACTRVFDTLDLSDLWDFSISAASRGSLVTIPTVRRSTTHRSTSERFNLLGVFAAEENLKDRRVSPAATDEKERKGKTFATVLACLRTGGSRRNVSLRLIVMWNTYSPWLIPPGVQEALKLLVFTPQRTSSLHLGSAERHLKYPGFLFVCLNAVFKVLPLSRPSPFLPRWLSVSFLPFPPLFSPAPLQRRVAAVALSHCTSVSAVQTCSAGSQIFLFFYLIFLDK